MTQKGARGKSKVEPCGAGIDLVPSRGKYPNKLLRLPIQPLEAFFLIEKEVKKVR